MRNIKSSYINGQLKIISGYLKGRKLLICKKSKFRPTISRMREILFNWLNNDIIRNSKCLDCFAGSGILGFEALSRGASKVVLLEINSIIYFQIKKNINLLKINKIKIFNKDVFYWILKSKDKFNLVFIDPPFRKGIVQKIINIIEKNNILMKKSWIYIENEIEEKNLNIPKSWKLYRMKLTKRVSYKLYIRIV